jgi:cytochrome bd-type quinol oxidase subunit 2
MLFQGLAFAAGRTQQDLQKSILRLARILAWVYLAVMLLFIATEYSNLPWAAVLGFGPVTRWPSLLGPRASCAFASKRPSAFCFFPL